MLLTVEQAAERLGTGVRFISADSAPNDD